MIDTRHDAGNIPRNNKDNKCVALPSWFEAINQNQTMLNNCSKMSYLGVTSPFWRFQLYYPACVSGRYVNLQGSRLNLIQAWEFFLPSLIIFNCEIVRFMVTDLLHLFHVSQHGNVSGGIDSCADIFSKQQEKLNPVSPLWSADFRRITGAKLEVCCKEKKTMFLFYMFSIIVIIVQKHPMSHFQSFAV